jgi:hypothetical protein
VQPLVSLDLDLVISSTQFETLEPLLAQRFTVMRFPYRLNLSLVDSDLLVQVQTDSRYADFITRWLEAYPELASYVPQEIRQHLID